MKQFLSLCFLSVLFVFQVQAQQSEINHNSSSSSPTMVLKETDGTTTPLNDFVRLWFQANTGDFWAFNAKPLNGSTDADGILTEPIIFAYNGTQLFGIGSNGKVRINKQYTLPGMDGMANQVLATDGSGTMNWTDLPTPGAGWAEKIEDADGDTYVNVESTTDSDEISFYQDGVEFVKFDQNSNGVRRMNFDFTYPDNNNLLIGNNVAPNMINGASGGRWNIALGRNALDDMIIGDDNVAIGNFTIGGDGEYNVALGNNALENTVGSGNTGLGSASIPHVKDGNVGIGTLAGIRANNLSDHNVFIGDRVLGSPGLHEFQDNVFVGKSSGLYAESCSNNTVLGYFAGSRLKSDDNVFIGTLAGNQNNSTVGRNSMIGGGAGYANTGEGNVFLGFQCGYSSGSGSNNVFIGKSAGFSETGSNKLLIANSGVGSPLIYGEFDNDLVKINGDFEVTDKLTLNEILNIQMLSTPPSSPSVGDVYLDDGSNHASASAGFRYYSASGWLDL